MVRTVDGRLWTVTIDISLRPSVHPTHRIRSRRILRGGAVAVGLALGSLTGPALAVPPQSWPATDNPPVSQVLLVLIGIPLLVVAILALLVYLPSMIRGTSSEPALAFQDRNEWFGGPSKGVDAAHDARTGAGASTADKGGASARW